jgi:hypothetical protein
LSVTTPRAILSGAVAIVWLALGESDATVSGYAVVLRRTSWFGGLATQSFSPLGLLLRRWQVINAQLTMED